MRFETELQEHSAGVMGTVVKGDMNVHNEKWLRHSSETTAAGRQLAAIAASAGLEQRVKEPTREANLLDLVLSDVKLSTVVLPQISDHKLVEVRLDLKVPEEVACQREVWCLSNADWLGLNEHLQSIDWTPLETMTPQEGAIWLGDTIHDGMMTYIGKRLLKQKKSTHPWLNKEIIELVKKRVSASGREEEKAAALACSEGIFRNYLAWAERSRQKLLCLGRGSKEWWAKSRQLLEAKPRCCSIPAVRMPTGEWVMESKAKADAFATHFGSKFLAPVIEIGRYSALDVAAVKQETLNIPSHKDSEELLLDPNSGTGPDDIPALVLRYCAKQLAYPVYLLGCAIVKWGEWPDVWRLHNIVPLHKKLSRHALKNYRGIHMTAHISKVLERFVAMVFEPHVTKHDLYGPRQWAYQRRKGARDTLAYLVARWLLALGTGHKVVLFCADVAGAFDRVDAKRLVRKLLAKGLHPQVVKVLESWLQQRKAYVVVGGHKSSEMGLMDMVFQGTVLGPALWNLFYEDVRRACSKCGFEESIFADDLDAFKVLPSSTDNAQCIQEAETCQTEVHAWGRSNGVAFEPSKESLQVLSKHDPCGAGFVKLGVNFDVKLCMQGEVDDLVGQCAWRVSQLLRGGRFFSSEELVFLYKQHVLSRIEYRTAAVYHAADTVLAPLDAVQRRVLRAAGVNELEALVHFRLAPLQTRRDIAMLGLLHRQALGRGPAQLGEIVRLQTMEKRRFTRLHAGRHGLQLESYCNGHHTDYMRRSLLGAIEVYNLLPGWVIDNSCKVSTFQKRLQELVLSRAMAGCEDWDLTLSPRMPSHARPLLACLL